MCLCDRPSSHRTVTPSSAHSSSPSSDSDDPDDNYVAMMTSSLSFSTGEQVKHTHLPCFVPFFHNVPTILAFFFPIYSSSSFILIILKTFGSCFVIWGFVSLLSLKYILIPEYLPSLYHVLTFFLSSRFHNSFTKLSTLLFTVSETYDAPGFRGRSQQPCVTTSQRWQTGGVPGPWPPHWAINTKQTGKPSLAVSLCHSTRVITFN